MGKVFEMGTDPHFSSKAKESRFVAGRRSCISQVSLRVTTSVPGHSPPDCISQPQPLSPPLTSSHLLSLPGRHLPRLPKHLPCQLLRSPSPSITHFPVLAAKSIPWQRALKGQFAVLRNCHSSGTSQSLPQSIVHLPFEGRFRTTSGTSSSSDLLRHACRRPRNKTFRG